jgi:NADH:ubiquinone oxidoreductase subunit 4 (subunit M)
VSQLNIGNIDRALRILAGLILVALAGFGLIGIWGYIGVVLIATGTIAICPLYTLLGVRTTSR